MITKYNDYLNEGFLKSKQYELESFLKKYFKPYLNNNFKIKKMLVGDIESAIKYSRFDNFYRYDFVFNDYKNINSHFNFSYRSYNYYISLFDKEYEYSTLKELKKSLPDIIKNYYDVYLSKVKENEKNKNITLISIKYILVFDKDMYSKFIYDIININNKYITQSKDYLIYLTDEYKNKIKHLIDANNFDLI